MSSPDDILTEGCAILEPALLQHGFECVPGVSAKGSGVVSHVEASSVATDVLICTFGVRSASSNTACARNPCHMNGICLPLRVVGARIPATRPMRSMVFDIS